MKNLFEIAEVQKRFDNGFDFVDVKTDDKIIRFYDTKKASSVYEANDGVAPNCILASELLESTDYGYLILDRSLYTIGRHPEEERIFSEAVKPLMKYLSENHHPHTTCIVQNNKAELVEGIMTYVTDEFILD